MNLHNDKVMQLFISTSATWSFDENWRFVIKEENIIKRLGKVSAVITSMYRRFVVWNNMQDALD